MPVVVPKPYSQMRAEFAGECRRLAEDAFQRYCRNLAIREACDILKRA